MSGIGILPEHPDSERFLRRPHRAKAESTRLNATDAQTGKRAPRVTVCFDGTTKPGSTLLDGGPNEQPPNQVGTCDTRAIEPLNPHEYVQNRPKQPGFDANGTAR